MLIEQKHSLEQIMTICFQELSKGAKMRRHPFRYVSLATVHQHIPSSRWVVHRQFTEEQRILIYTDERSDKIKALKANPAASLLYLHDRHNLQLRFNGSIKIHYQNELSRKYWPGVKGAGAQDYTSVLPPGKPISSPSVAHEWSDELTDEHFVVLEFNPQCFDVLQLNRNQHIRAQFDKINGNWEGSFIVP